MMSRGHKALFVVLLLACVAMAAVLIRLRNRAEDRLREQAAEAPVSMNEPAGNPAATVTLYVPNDLDDSLTTVNETLPLPEDESLRARMLLASLVDAFHAPGSTHPMDVTDGVNGVYLMAVPHAPGQPASTGQLAVVDLSAALAAAQPSGIEPETLTLLSMLATLHANLPSISEVRFLVDGQTKETLAGHADLTRTYLAAEANPTSNPGAGESGGQGAGQ